MAVYDRTSFSEQLQEFGLSHFCGGGDWDVGASRRMSAWKLLERVKLQGQREHAPIGSSAVLACSQGRQ